jgi:hypothetical protein
MKKKHHVNARVQKLSDGRFLFRVGQAIQSLGVIGERRNCLILTLAAMTRVFDAPVSILVKGAPSTGKSTMVKKVIELHPASLRIERASLSEKALAHGQEPMSQKILFLSEYRGGKDSRLLMRLLQSEGQISHEYTTISGNRRGTSTAVRRGSPVVLSTTTDAKVFEDDETRFMSIWADESPKQTLEILRSQSRARAPKKDQLRRWREFFGNMYITDDDFQDMPVWLDYVAKRLPIHVVRVRRDWARFLTLLKAVALCRRFQTNNPLQLCFGDYCVAYKILEPALAATVLNVRERELEVAQAVRRLAMKGNEPTVRRVATELGWERAVTYKHVKSAVKNGLLKHKKGSRVRNLKPLVLTKNTTKGFLPAPLEVLNHNATIGDLSIYFDPFTGERHTLRRG